MVVVRGWFRRTTSDHNMTIRDARVTRVSSVRLTIHHPSSFTDHHRSIDLSRTIDGV